jgi:hypothetical protein
VDRLTGSDGQDDAGVLDLEPAEPAMACHRLKDGDISVGQFHRARFASTHGATSQARPGHTLSIPPHLNLLHDFVPAPLVCRQSSIDG